MTERKPPGTSFESWVDQQVREAMERGDFDNLPGAGKPIPDLDRPYGDVWFGRVLGREGVPPEEYLPTSLRLRREVELLPEAVRAETSEDAVRRAVCDLNDRIAAWHRDPRDGPRIAIGLVDVERVVEKWRRSRTPGPDLEPGPEAGAEGVEGSGGGAAEGRPDRRTGWRDRWHRRRGRRG